MKKYILVIILFIVCLTFNLNAQNNPKLHFLIGANISNPHQLFEGAANVYGGKSLKPFGNVYGALIYKNRCQLSLGSELNEYTTSSYFNNDLFLNFRYYFLKDSAMFKPYFETGLVLNTFGESEYIVRNQQSYHFNLGFTYKISNHVNFDFGISQQFRKMELYDVAAWSNDEITLTMDRFMIRTGLIFKVL